MRIAIFGNAGSGKSTMAQMLCRAFPAACLSLDEIAWDQGALRKPIETTLRLLNEFLAAHAQWIIEGCYGQLIEALLPHCTELRFLNPGVAACVANCRRRPWEPDKFPSPQAQNEMLHTLICWVREYETREDEYGLNFHRRVFDSFRGPKREYTSMPDGADLSCEPLAGTGRLSYEDPRR